MERANCIGYLAFRKLMHTDLNPENILFLKITDTEVVDFGNAMYDDGYHSPVMTTCAFPAPESQPCDIWSTGCLLMEYGFGNILFLTYNSKEHMAMMERVVGPLPRHMVQNRRKCRYLTQSQLAWNENTHAGQCCLRLCKPLLVRRQREILLGRRTFWCSFRIKNPMVMYDPAERFTLEAVLKHPFFFPLKRGKKVMVSCR
uniref:dual-specificity kinase n=1 Tax=Melopsittacus undulatus TaxID=13146 RepID=A0A8C6NFQ8_MELUD